MLFVSFCLALGECFYECVGSCLAFNELLELPVKCRVSSCLLFVSFCLALGECFYEPVKCRVSFCLALGECFHECVGSGLVFGELPELLVKCSTLFCLALGECFQDFVGARLTFTEFFNGSLLGLGKGANNSGDLPKLLHNHLNPLIAFHVAFSEGSGVCSKLLQKASYPFNLLLKCVALLSVKCIHHICSFEPTQIETRAEITSIALPSRPRGLHPLTRMEELSKHVKLPQ